MLLRPKPAYCELRPPDKKLAPLQKLMNQRWKIGEGKCWSPIGDDTARRIVVANAKSKLTTKWRGKNWSPKSKVTGRRDLCRPVVAMYYYFFILNFPVTRRRVLQSLCGRHIEFSFLFLTVHFSNSRRQFIWQPVGRHFYEFEFRGVRSLAIVSINNPIVISQYI